MKEFLTDTLEKLETLTSKLSAAETTTNGMNALTPPSPTYTGFEATSGLREVEISDVEAIRELLAQAKELVVRLHVSFMHTNI